MSKTDKAPSPVADNRYGEGVASQNGARFWFIIEGCPVHDNNDPPWTAKLTQSKELEDR